MRKKDTFIEKRNIPIFRGKLRDRANEAAMLQAFVGKRHVGRCKKWCWRARGMNLEKDETRKWNNFLNCCCSSSSSVVDVIFFYFSKKRTTMMVRIRMHYLGLNFFLKKMGLSWPLFVFLSFSHHNSKINWKSVPRCCAWGSNPGPQDGRCKWIRWGSLTRRGRSQH